MKKESTIQQEIVSYLSGIAQQYNFIFFAVPNEGFLKAIKGLLLKFLDNNKKFFKVSHSIMTILKKMGLTPGIPDLCLLHDSRAYMFEVKRPGEKLTNRQENIHELLNDKISIPTFIVSSVEDVEIILSEMEII